MINRVGQVWAVNSEMIVLVLSSKPWKEDGGMGFPSGTSHNVLVLEVDQAAASAGYAPGEYSTRWLECGGGDDMEWGTDDYRVRLA